MSDTLRDLVLAARGRLAGAGIEADEAWMDAAMLARHVLDWDLARFIAHDTDPPPAFFRGAFDAVVARRARREPMSSITRRREFWGLEFEVGPEVLAPRPETEIIVEEAVACLAAVATEQDGPTEGPSPVPQRVRPEPVEAGAARARQARAGRLAPLFIDVGTGSGCLAVCLAREFPQSRVIATDTSPAALSIAERNARRHGVGDRIEFRQASLLDGVTESASLIVSNPPYVASADIATLPPEVRDWEPLQALDGGPEGLDVVRALLARAPSVLAPGGWLIMEFGHGQQPAVGAAVRAAALELVRITNDLQGIPRTVVARVPTSHDP